MRDDPNRPPRDPSPPAFASNRFPANRPRPRRSGESALLVADYHAGYEAGLRYERGVDVPSRAPGRRERLLALLERTDPDRLVVLGDLMHSIGDRAGPNAANSRCCRSPLQPISRSPSSRETTTVESKPGSRTATISGRRSPWSRRRNRSAISASVTAHLALPERSSRARWSVGHEHPCVRLEDEVGGSRPKGRGSAVGSIRPVSRASGVRGSIVARGMGRNPAGVVVAGVQRPRRWNVDQRGRPVVSRRFFRRGFRGGVPAGRYATRSI